ncbi:MAG: hypothetical protein KAW41_06265 [Candidatus Diapherotrites archaeon]|nr:hypothetical protein [Candidatus Diapherotrites archaeon]
MSKCAFCDDVVMDELDDEGTMGHKVGNILLCDGCLKQLKDALNEA